MNYIIEDNINFYDNLYNDTDDSDNECNNNNEICLITYEPLTTNYVKMNCGHKFNYLPLFNDIVNHKLKYNNLEHYKSGRLKLNEIRCPYCRNKQTTLLPYYENSGFAKVNGVNFLDHSIGNGNGNVYNIYNKCSYKKPNLQFDDTLPEDVLYNNQYIECSSCYASPIIGISFTDNNSYCFYHKKIMVAKYKKEAIKASKLKAKEEKEAAKLKAKEEKEVAKLKAKEEKEAAKLKAKEEKEAAKLKVKEEKEAAKLKAKEEKEAAKLKAKEEKEVAKLKDKTTIK